MWAPLQTGVLYNYNHIHINLKYVDDPIGLKNPKLLGNPLIFYQFSTLGKPLFPLLTRVQKSFAFLP